MLEIKSNFFTSAAPAPSMPEIAFSNDPKYRARFGEWLSDNYDVLVSEYKQYGRFLTLREIQENPLD